MDDFCDPETPVSTSCPHCGHTSTVESTDSLSPQVCSHCQQIHVATLNTKNANESQESQEPVLSATEVGPSQPAMTYLGKIGRYRVTKVLGTGAFGVVYQAWDPRLHRWVAIKVPKLAQRRQVVEDFLREARTAARLRHPRIVSVYDAETANGRPFIVVEFVEGSTLAAQLMKGAIAPRRAARIIYELAMAVNYAHQQGIIHRDIKPANIMIDDRGMPRLMDFGLAQLSANQATLGGVIAGTPAYLAPEVARREPDAGGHASDQYSLGIVFYECLVGRRPFEPFQGNLFDLLRLVATQAPARLQSVNPDIPDELDHICGKMTTLTAAERYSDLGAVARQLSLYLKPVTDANISTVAATNSNLGRLGIGVAVSVIAILLIAIMMRSGPSHSSTQIAPDSESSNSAVAVVATPAIVASTPEFLTPPSSTELAPTNVGRATVVPPGNPSQESNSEAEMPADALMAVAVVQERQPPPEVEAKPELVDLKPSFPPLILEAESDRPAFLMEWRALMKTGFNRLDDKAFEKVLLHVKKLRQLAPREPRVPYALAIIRIRYVPSKAVDATKLPVALQLLREAQLIGGYPFTPAYLSEVDLALSGKIEPLRDALSETANSITVVATWPDVSERLRVARWLGGPFAYYGSGISGSSANDLQIRKLQDDVELRLSKNLQSAFLSSILETQAEFGMVDTALEKRLSDAKAESDDRIKQKLLKIAMDREAASKKVETQQLDDQGIDNEFKAKAAVLETEFKALQVAAAPLMANHQILSQRIAVIQMNIARSMLSTKLTPDPSAAATGSGLVDSTGGTAGAAAGGPSSGGPAPGGGGAAARLELQQLYLQLAVVNSQMDRCRIEVTVLQEKAFYLERDYTKKKGKSLDTLSKLSRELKSLDLQAKATATTKATKLPDDVLRNRRIVKTVRNWVQWSVNDAKEWLSSSIEQAEK